MLSVRPLRSMAAIGSVTSMTLGLTLVRHGETQHNKEGLLQGKAWLRPSEEPVKDQGFLLFSPAGQAIDSPLSETGVQQADAAGRYLRDVKFTNVFVSDMLRAKQTAESIMKHNSSCSRLQMTCDPLLKEKSFGVSEGRPVKEMRAMAKAAGQAFPNFTPPKGETQEQVKERVKQFLDKMLLQMGNGGKDDDTSLSEGGADDAHALVVTHGAYMCVAVRYFVEELGCNVPQGCDQAHMFSLSPNTGMCRFLVTAGKVEDRFVVSVIHCEFIHRANHLQ